MYSLVVCYIKDKKGDQESTSMIVKLADIEVMLKYTQSKRKMTYSPLHRTTELTSSGKDVR